MNLLTLENIKYSTDYLHIQDLKVCSTGGGRFHSTGTWHTRDINYIVQNKISGASLTSSGSHSSNVKGAVGPNDAILNNPSGGASDESYFTLPSGEYYIMVMAGHSYYTGTISYRLYDKTGSSPLLDSKIPMSYGAYYDTAVVPAANSQAIVGKFSLGSTSNLKIETMSTSTADKLGTDRAMGLDERYGSQTYLACYLDAQIYKLD